MFENIWLPAWVEPLNTSSAVNLAFTSASVYPTLFVFVVIAEACPPLIVVVLPASAVVPLVPICKVVTEPPNDTAEPSIVILEFVKSSLFIAPAVISCPLIVK